MAPATWLGRVLAMAVDLFAVGCECPPRGAELGESLAGGLAGGLVGDVVVERVAVVGDLECAVLASGGAEQSGVDASPGVRLALGRQWRPEGGARAVAGALVALVLDEVVERQALGVDEDGAERRAADGDRRSGRGRGGDGGGRRMRPRVGRRERGLQDQAGGVLAEGRAARAGEAGGPT